jgi:hypothetical protein
VFSSIRPVSIGSRQQAAGDFNFQFNGTVDDVAIYNYALSANQVFAHYLAAQRGPLITLQPTNTTVNEGNTATFYTSAYGSTPQGYYWYQSLDNGTTFNPIGINSSNLVLTAVPGSWDQSQYYMVATNIYASSTSSIVTLSVLTGPASILVDIPPTNIVYAGNTVVYAATVGGSASTMQWQKNGVNMSDGGRISGANSNVLVIVNAQASDAATYQLFVVNGQGNAQSTLSYLFVETVPDFNGTGLGWTMNGGATINGDILTLTDGVGSEARSAFYQYKQYIGAFQAFFTYQDVGGAGADGTVFVIQNDTRGLAALGAGGGTLAYAGITPSVGLEMNIYAPNTVGFAFRTNGLTGVPYTPATPVNIASGNPIDVSLNYLNSTLRMVMSNTVTADTFSTSINVGSLPTLLGADTAYIGFTGATGGTASTQTITNFWFVPITGLTFQRSGATTAILSWPAKIGGYVVQSTPSLAPPITWQNVAAPVNLVGGFNQVTVPTETGTLFYRLALTQSEP